MEEEAPTPSEPFPAEPAPAEAPPPEEKEPPVGGKWFRKIPKEILLSPGGVILIFLASFLETIDFFIPPSLADSLIIEAILEAPFMAMLAVVAKLPLQSFILPFIIERLPGISDLFPTWLLKLFNLI